MTFWGHGHGAGALPGEAEAGQEGPRLGQTATQTGEFKDAFGGFGGGANGPFGERLPNDLDMVGEFADGFVLESAAESFEASVAVGDEVSFGGRLGDVRDGGGLGACVSEVDTPEHEPFAADDGIGVAIAVAENLGLFVAWERGSKPSGGHP